MTVVHHLYVQGMMCQKNCGHTVQQALLNEVPDAIDAETVFTESRAWVRTDTTTTTTRSGTTKQEQDYDSNTTFTVTAAAAAAITAVEDVGFDATPCQLIELHVDGMMCQQNCGTTVQNALQQTFFQALLVYVNFARQRAVLLMPTSSSSSSSGGGGANDELSLETIQRMAVEAIEDVGFEARVWTQEDSDSVNIIDVEAGEATDALLPKPPSTSTSTTVDSSGNTSFSLAIEGMSCAVCTGRVVSENKDYWYVASTMTTRSQQTPIVYTYRKLH
jgi:hypothetical protein